jgi:hypothetical protein
VRPHGRIRQFGLVTTPNEHPPSLVALSIAIERQREAAIEKLDRDRHLLLTTVIGQRSSDELALNPASLEVTSNPLIPPAVNQPPVLSKPPRIPRIINQPLTDNHANHIVNHNRIKPPTSQRSTKLSLGPLTKINQS